MPVSFYFSAMAEKEYVVLVNEHDEPTGLAEKMEAHRKGLLHRAFSVVIYDNAGKMLIHRRAASKYHSPGLWTNACCSHPRKDESLEEAAIRRLQEEMGFTTHLKRKTSFIYKAQVGELIEHEYDHLLEGTFNGEPKPDPAEVMEWKYLPVEEIRQEIKNHPERYTEWFKIILAKLD